MELESLAVLEKKVDVIASDIRKLKRAVNECQLNSREIMWADSFNLAIRHSKWMKRSSYTLGRAAVGYNFMYVLYRICNELHPTQILEMGMGQTTSLLTQYAVHNRFGTDKVSHFVVEQDQEWSDYYTSNIKMPRNSHILLHPAVLKMVRNEEVLSYEGLKEAVSDTRFDLILVDGPIHGEETNFRRIDTLDLIPEHLAERWIMLFDDQQRLPDRNGTELVKERLQEFNIPFCEGWYKGKKDVQVLACTEWKFVCTM